MDDLSTEKYLGRSEKRDGTLADAFSSQGAERLPSQAHRQLEPRHVHLLAIGGTLGTAVFLGIGSALTSGGPLSLLIGFALWSSVMWCINEGQAEMVCQLPIQSSFVRFAGRYVDESIGAALGYSYTIGWMALVCFELVSFGIVLGFWTGPLENWAKAVIIVCMLLAYGVLNLWNVRFFGEIEFWMALGKILLISGLILMTFIVMVGGNPRHWAFGFTYWVHPGAMAEYIHTGDLGRFEGVLACVIYAGFTIAGPDVLSLAAGEARNPRRTMPFAFKSVMFRLVLVFVVGSLAVGIIVPYNNGNLLHAISTDASGAAKSPYVIGMQILNIPVLPHIVNAGVLTSVFSAGNAFVYCASRSLYGLAADGQAPKIFLWRNRNGVPMIAVTLILAFGCLAFMELNHSSNVVLNWFINIVTSAQIVTWAVMALTHIRWDQARNVQGYSRDSLIYKSRIQPYGAYYAFSACLFLLLANGYAVFVHGLWSAETFVFSYFMIPFFGLIFLVHKIWRRTKWRVLEQVDLVGETAEIEAYEASLEESQEEDGRSSDVPANGELGTGNAKPSLRRRLGKIIDRAGFVLY